MARNIATITVVSRPELIAFIESRHHAIVITTRENGRPQTWSPIATGGFPPELA